VSAPYIIDFIEFVCFYGQLLSEDLSVVVLPIDRIDSFNEWDFNVFDEELSALGYSGKGSGPKLQSPESY
jgi:hypothetical protein